jgi:hypothetical protein
MLQWRKWRDSSSEVVSMQLEASMETALIQVASHYINVMQALQDERDDAYDKLSNTDSEKVEEKLRVKLTKEIRKELEKEIRAEIEEQYTNSTVSEIAKKKDAPAEKKSTKKTESKPAKKEEKPKQQSKPKKSGGLFGAKKVKKKYDGEEGGKVDWFLKEALDTVYDPHGTGKVIKAATILARSSEGNVRVRDVVRIYASEGEDGISELAWTSPFTKYIIEAFDEC